MADESDVEAALVDLIDADLYPHGSGGPCMACSYVKIFPGWPVAEQLERDLNDGTVSVSVFPAPGTAGSVGQPFNMPDTVLTPADHGLTAAVMGRTITLSGVPTCGEYVTATLGTKGYSYLTVQDDTAVTAAQGLAALIVVDHPGTNVQGASVTLPDGADPVVRIGGPVTMGRRIHRQRQQFRVTIWAPSPESRNDVAKRVDVALKRENVIRLPDTTQALIVATGSIPSDRHALEAAFRRDLMFDVTYDTLDAFPAYEVTHVEIGREIISPEP